MLHQTKVLLDRAIAMERAGHWQSAIDLCGEVFSRSVSAGNVEDLREAVLRMGNAYLWKGDTDLAAEHLDLAFILAELHGDSRRAGRAANGLAVMHQIHGEVDQAEEKYAQARFLALESGDVQSTGDIDQNLGALANVRGQLNEALAHYTSGLESYERIGHERGIARVLNNLGMLYIDLDRLDEAAVCLDRALTVSRTVGDVQTEEIVHLNRTELFIAQGDSSRARVSCDEAFELSSRLEDNEGKAEALKFYGVIYRETNKLHLAETHLRHAIGIAAKYRYPLPEAESQRELALVLRAQDRNREALAALNRSHELFGILKAQRDQADVNQRLDKLQEDFLSLVRSWGESIEAKDRYTSGHCQRVADYACRIAQEAGVPESEMPWFRMGAFLHDVGKTEVPEEILNKPGKLSVEERELMERHTIVGYEMLSSIQFPWDILPMVRSHHERWDGAGYPDRLKGEEIPFPARILRLADIYDALTTTRSYRQPLTPEQALQIMEQDAGSFDPELLEIFRNLFPEFRKTVLELRVPG